MKYRELGTSGLRVSVLGLGGNTFGPPRIDSATTVKVVHAALASGVTFFDTAIDYGQGQSEIFLGRALRGKRDHAVIATKFHFHDLDGDPVRRVREHCERSLRKLETDHLDLLQVHSPSDQISTDDLLTVLSQLRDEGKLRAYGASNYSSWRLAESAARAGTLGVPAFASLQTMYNVLHRRPDQELVAACRRYGTSVIPFHPLASGFLTGKYRQGEPPPPGSRGAAGSIIARHVSTERNWAVLAELERFAADRGRTVGELAIAWLVAKPFVASVITGISNRQQLQQNLHGAEWTLTETELAEIDGLTDSSENAPVEDYAAVSGRRAAR